MQILSSGRRRCPLCQRVLTQPWVTYYPVNDTMIAAMALYAKKGAPATKVCARIPPVVSSGAGSSLHSSDASSIHRQKAGPQPVLHPQHRHTGTSRPAAGAGSSKAGSDFERVLEATREAVSTGASTEPGVSALTDLIVDFLDGRQKERSQPARNTDVARQLQRQRQAASVQHTASRTAMAAPGFQSGSNATLQALGGAHAMSLDARVMGATRAMSLDVRARVQAERMKLRARTHCGSMHEW